jgi:hypothetical protein
VDNSRVESEQFKFLALDGVGPFTVFCLKELGQLAAVCEWDVFE